MSMQQIHETCLNHGAWPGSWTQVPVHRRACSELILLGPDAAGCSRRDYCTKVAYVGYQWILARPCDCEAAPGIYALITYIGSSPTVTPPHHIRK